MNIHDRIHHANSRSKRIPGIVFRVLLAWLLGAIVLAVGVPALRARGIDLQGWMVWVVILVTLALAVLPDLLRRRERP